MESISNTANPSSRPVYDEMFDAGGKCRTQYEALFQRLERMPAEELRQRQHAADLSFLHQGITFNVYRAGNVALANAIGTGIADDNATAHSFGLETLVAEEFLNIERLEHFLRDYLIEAGRQDIAFCRAAHRMASVTYTNEQRAPHSHDHSHTHHHH